MEYKVGDKVMVKMDDEIQNVKIINIYKFIGYNFEYLYDGILEKDKQLISFGGNEIIKEEVEEKKYLKTWEAIKALEEGYKIKCVNCEGYVCFDKDGILVNEDNLKCNFTINEESIKNKWEIYEESKKEIPKEFEGLKYILGSINNMDCDDKDCDKCPLGIEKCDMLDEIFFDMKEKYNF